MGRIKGWYGYNRMEFMGTVEFIFIKVIVLVLFCILFGNLEVLLCLLRVYTRVFGNAK